LCPTTSLLVTKLVSEVAVSMGSAIEEYNTPGAALQARQNGLAALLRRDPLHG